MLVMEKLKCGVIGLGRVGKMHVKNIIKIFNLYYSMQI